LLGAIASINQPDPAASQAAGAGMIQRVQQAIKQASLRTGVDFSYLLNKASQESSLDPNAKAAGSTATGLFQFTQQTWLQMIKNDGTQYGLDQYAAHISVDSNGVAHVTDPKWRSAILALRKDPTVSAEMAGELDKQNFDSLKSGAGGKIGPTELYLAHFLGAGGASDFINEMRQNPNAKAAGILPEAAAANPSVFYDKSGSARSFKQIYQKFALKFDQTPQLPGGSVMVASEAQNLPFTTANTTDANVNSPEFSSSAMSTHITAPASSLYATMVLAQIDMKNSAGRHFGSGNDENERKKNQMSVTIPVTIS